MHTTITNQLTQAVKVSQVLPFLKIIGAQNRLDLTKVSQFKKAFRILNISINQN